MGPAPADVKHYPEAPRGRAAVESSPYFAAEAGDETAMEAVLAHGGTGYAKEYRIERLLREV